MNSAQPATATRQAHLPGEVGIWVFIMGDLLIFALFFATYLFYRGPEAELFRAAQGHLDQGIGLVNTLVLLTSSLFVARGVEAVRQGSSRFAAGLFLLAILCGAAFLGNKALEWILLVREGHTLLSSNFYMYFFMYTGIHALHVVIGMAALLFTALRLRGGQATDGAAQSLAESTASFWHLVDLLWIVLFALLYLI